MSSFYCWNEITKLIPSNDLLTLKRIKKIRKVLSKEKRSGNIKMNKESDDVVDVDYQDNDKNGNKINKNLLKKSLTINDILSDSDTDNKWFGHW